VLAELVRHLRHYPYRGDALALEIGFRQGFTLGFSGQLRGKTAPNLPSIARNMREARALINQEVAAGRVAGPFKRPPLPSLRCSPIGLVQKHNGKFRLIHNLSWGRDGSVNDGINANHARVKYTSFDQVVDNIALLGKGTLLAKCDVRSAFRLLPVNPEDYPLLGFTFDNNYYFDMCVPFGCKSSCKLWEQLARFLNWRVQQYCGDGSAAVHHYLDDFIFLGMPKTSRCQALMNKFIQLCHTLAIPLADEKMEGPSTVLIFLGLTIDTEKMEVRVPTVKIAKALTLVGRIIKRNKITLRELQSIIGSLSFLCRAIRPGRAFLQRMIAMTKGVRKPFYYIRVSQGARLDAIMWRCFLTDFNGSAAFLPTIWQDSSILQFYSDASRTLGYGAYFAGKWFCGRWPKPLHNWSIAVCELFPIVLGVVT